MAITDHRRIKTVNSFFNPSEVYKRDINVIIGDKEYNIPLSKGVNVIIGDNSVGKSLFLHKLTKYIKEEAGILKKTIVKGYEKYLKNNKMKIITELNESDIFKFDMQGEVRRNFEEGNMKSNKFFNDYYPSPIQSDFYKEKIKNKLNSLYEFLETKFCIEERENKLSKFEIVDTKDYTVESLTFVGKVPLNKENIKEYSKIIESINTSIEKIKNLDDNKLFEESDKQKISNIVKQLEDISNKYINKKKALAYNDKKIGIYNSTIEECKEDYQNSISDSQKKLSTYNEYIKNVIDELTDIIIKKNQNKIPDITLEEEEIKIENNCIYNYSFNSRLNIVKISADYITNLFNDLRKKNYRKSILEVTEDELYASLSNIKVGKEAMLEDLKDKINKKVESDFLNKFTITESGIDKTQELSSGLNSKIYFDLISYEKKCSRIYIIDQPEDNVSQKAIREYLLDRFKVMGENRQVIIVTHNPQFIVNLDVDNVIYIGKENDSIFIQSGALEYKDDDYNILDIISVNIEGGLDTLKRRWKRYEKNNSI